MKVVNIFPGIYHFQAKDQYELTSTFIRLQEFYESPYKQIRGQYFELEEFFDVYAKKMGNMTYFTDWNGFNVPGHVVNEFLVEFGHNDITTFNYLREKEEIFVSCFSDHCFGDHEEKKYYIIGTWREDDIDHELCHAWYYLDSEFKKHADACVKVLKNKYRQQYDMIVKWLLKEGYSRKVLNDEIMAYMATSPREYMKSRMGDIYDYSVSFRVGFGVKKDEQEKIGFKKRVV